MSQSGSTLLSAWEGPHGGGPPFDKVGPADFKPALLSAMAEARGEIAAIAAAPETPSFADAFEALEASGETLNRVHAVFEVFSSAMNDGEMRAVETEMAPALAAFSDEIVQNAALFERLENAAAGANQLSAEQQRLAEVVLRNFARKGARLDAAAKARLAEINQRLASLQTRFTQSVLCDEEDFALTLVNEADLAGLPESLVAFAADAAREAGEAGWRFANTRSAIEPFLTFSERRDLREKAWRMWTSRGDRPGERDNKPLIAEILALRAEKARLLGEPSFAHWTIADQMAASPKAAMDLMERVWEAAKARFSKDLEEIGSEARDGGFAGAIEPWDLRFWSERTRKSRYAFDQSELEPYLQLESLIEAMFWTAGRLHGLSFVEVHDLPVYEPSVRTFEVRRGSERVGLFYFDPYARPGKSSGAWMSEYRTQQDFARRIDPIVSNNANFVKGAPGQSVLVSFDDATTLFHEFGHGLHGLLSKVAYPTLAGTNVARDFVEFPSQLNERWLLAPQLLTRFCRHCQTGETIPAALIDKVRRARRFGKAFETIEYLSSALIDMKAHLADPAGFDAARFEAEELARIGMPSQVVMRHRLP
ncbi:MAG: M3 family metallopeptidase, partial [Caulobacteraceae bacterium]